MLSRLHETTTVLHHPQPLDSGEVLLAEAHHRAANEVTAALAGMHLARSAPDHQACRALLDRAIDRLHAFGECSRLLATPTRDPGVRQRILDYNADDVRASAVVLDGLRALPVSGPIAWPPSGRL